jgi:hypothetical protein
VSAVSRAYARAGARPRWRDRAGGGSGLVSGFCWGSPPWQHAGRVRRLSPRRFADLIGGRGEGAQLEDWGGDGMNPQARLAVRDA